MAETPTMGSGGFVCTPRMSALIAQAGVGVLPSSEGGQELRDLYQVASSPFDPDLLNEFAFLCFMGHLEGVKKAVETGEAPALAGTETPFKFGYATLVVAGSQRLQVPRSNTRPPLHSATLEFLLDNGCPLDVPDICRYTALSHATMMPQDNADLARILVARGADVNHPDIYGMTPICGARMSAHSKAVDVLMEGGADLDITDADEWCMRKCFMNAGPKVTAVIREWERRRTGERVPLGEKGCALCGKEGKLKFCSACHSIRYCSSECQRSHWKKHKPSCKRFSASNTVTVKPRYAAGNASLIPMQQLARGISGFPASVSERRQRASHEATEYPKKLVIKVQIPQMPSSIVPVLVYDAKRELVCNLFREDAPTEFDRLTEVVRAKGTFGLKAYFAADLESKDQLIIKIDETLAEQPF